MQHGEEDGPEGTAPQYMDAILNALLDEPDPITRYGALTAAQADFEALTRRIAIERARTVAGMHDAGLSYGRIAEELGFTRARAQQLSERADQPHTQHERTAPQMTEPHGLTDFLHGYVQDWHARPHERPDPLRDTSRDLQRTGRILE